MVDKELLVKNRKKKRWSINKERLAQIENLKTLPVDDKMYKDTLGAIEQTGKIRKDKVEVWTKVVQVVGTLAVVAFAAKSAYEVDKSDEILTNKNSHGLFSKILHF